MIGVSAVIGVSEVPSVSAVSRVYEVSRVIVVSVGSVVSRGCLVLLVRQVRQVMTQIRLKSQRDSVKMRRFVTL